MFPLVLASATPAPYPRLPVPLRTIRRRRILKLRKIPPSYRFIWAFRWIMTAIRNAPVLRYRRIRADGMVQSIYTHAFNRLDSGALALPMYPVIIRADDILDGPGTSKWAPFHPLPS